ncbi:MAG: ROK family protein [Muribaculaceae bacterium]|jgi:glucokinase|nr:ROK family protein [Muribaculaceae bacterium]
MKPYVLGIDIGGTNTVFGIVDARGNVIASSSIKTQRHNDFYLYLDELYAAASKLIEANEATDKIQGIGIGAPNANYYTGRIENAVNLPWPSINLAELVSEKFGIPVAITNDANAAALGEMTYGAARGMKDFIMITLGTGVGSGIVINGQMVYGANGFAGELGHVIVKRNNGRLCGCGRTGCLETYCSATGVARTAREFLEARTEPSILRHLDIDAITSKDVYDAAVQGDKLAKDVFEYTGNILGEAMADMVSFSAPEAFILFGGLSKSGDLLLKPVCEALERNMLPCFKGLAKVILSELKEADAAVLGASALGWEAKRISESI